MTSTARRSIALVHDVPTPGHTGGHTLFHRLRTILQRHHTVREYSFARGGPRASALYYPLFPLARPVAEGARARFDLVVTNWSGYFPVAGDFFYVQPPSTGAGSPASLARRLGIGRPAPPGLWPKPVQWLWYNRIARPMLDRAALQALERTGTLVAASRRVQAQLKDEFQRDALQVYPSLSAETLASLSSVRRERSRQGRLVLLIGRLEPGKSLEDLVAIANALPGRQFAALGRVPWGGEPYTAALARANAARNLQFYPNANEATKHELLKRAAVLLHMAAEDTFPVSVVEGVLAGLQPVVRSPGGAEEWVGSERCFRTTEEAVALVETALASPPEVGGPVLEAASRIADPARFEREVLQAIEIALRSRRR